MDDLERRGCRVIVILNAEAFTPDDAAEFRGLSEKVFDHQVLFDPSPRECTSTALPVNDERSAPLRESCEKRRITNIRILQRARRLVHDFAPFMKRHDGSIARRLARLGGTHQATPEEEKSEAFLSSYGFRGGDPIDRKIEAEKRLANFETAWDKLFHDFDETDTTGIPRWRRRGSRRCSASGRRRSTSRHARIARRSATLHSSLPSRRRARASATRAGWRRCSSR